MWLSISARVARECKQATKRQQKENASLTYKREYKQADKSNERPTGRKNCLRTQGSTTYVEIRDENNLCHARKEIYQKHADTNSCPPSPRTPRVCACSVWRVGVLGSPSFVQNRHSEESLQLEEVSMSHVADAHGIFSNYCIFSSSLPVRARTGRASFSHWYAALVP